MKFLKVIIGVVLFFLVLLLVAPYVVPSKTYLPSIVRVFEKNHPFKIKVQDGSLSILPRPELRLKDVSIHAKDQEAKHSFMQAKKINISAQWSALFAKEIKLRVLIDDADINVIKFTKDHHNTDDLLKKKSLRQLMLESKKEGNNRIMGKKVKVRRIKLKDIKIYYQPLGGELEKVSTIPLLAADLNSEIDVFKFEFRLMEMFPQKIKDEIF